MSITNSLHRLNTAQQLRQKLDRDPSNVAALLETAAMLGTFSETDLELKRKVLKRVLFLEPANPKARQMLFEMDRAEIGGEASRLSAAVILTDPSSNDLLEKPLKLRYSILHQFLVYPVVAFTMLLMFMAFGEWDVFFVFTAFLFVLLVPIWFVSAVLEVGNSSIRLSRWFGVYRREMEWSEIETIQPAIMGVGLKLTAGDGRSVSISSQMHGYSSFVEILRQRRPNLFDMTGGKIFQKGFFAKYGVSFLLILTTPMALSAVVVPPFIPGILLTALTFYLWKSALQSIHLVKVEEDSLSVKSLRKSHELTVRQIKNIDMVTARNRRGVSKSMVRIELNGEGTFTLSGFPEGNEIVYGFLKNWWSGYQTS